MARLASHPPGTRLLKDFQSAIAQQQKEMETVVARLKEQESKIQKVNARLGVSKAAPQMVAND